MLNNIHHVNNIIKYKEYSYIVPFVVIDSVRKIVIVTPLIWLDYNFFIGKDSYSIFNLLYYGTFLLQFEFFSVHSIPFYSRFY